MADWQVSANPSHKALPAATTDSKVKNEQTAHLSTSIAASIYVKAEPGQLEGTSGTDPVLSQDRPETVPGKPFPFMKLPAELRIMILKEALKAPSQVRCPMKLTQSNHERSIVTTSRALRVSKTFYNEAMPIYFRCNTFHFKSLNELKLYLLNFRVESRRSIRSLSILWRDYHPDNTVKLLRGCVSLRRLSILLRCEHLHFGAKWFLTFAKRYGIEELLKIRGIEQLDVRRDQRCERCSIGDVAVIANALQVLQQPYSAAELRLQNRKDYVWGTANVVTRSKQRNITSGGKAMQRAV